MGSVITRLGTFLTSTATDVWDHHYGKHGAFRGRRYRRGEKRCAFCGAFNNTKFKDPIPPIKRLFKNA